MKMEIINKGSMLRKQGVGEDNKMKILNKIQVKGKSNMFRSRETPLKVTKLIKKNIIRLEKVVINKKSLINLIVGDRIEVDNNTEVVLKVVVEVIMIMFVAVNNTMKMLVAVNNTMKMLVAVNNTMIMLIAVNNTMIIGK